MHFVPLCSREEGRKILILKMNSIWLMEKNKRIDVKCIVKLCVKINKITF